MKILQHFVLITKNTKDTKREKHRVQVVKDDKLHDSFSLKC